MSWEARSYAGLVKRIADEIRSEVEVVREEDSAHLFGVEDAARSIVEFLCTEEGWGLLEGAYALPEHQRTPAP